MTGALAVGCAPNSGAARSPMLRPRTLRSACRLFIRSPPLCGHDGRHRPSLMLPLTDAPGEVYALMVRREIILMPHGRDLLTLARVSVDNVPPNARIRRGGRTPTVCCRARAMRPPSPASGSYGPHALGL